MKYKVTCEELIWYTTEYAVEAENEEEAKDKVYNSQDLDLIYEEYDYIDQRDVIDIKPYETN